MNPPLSVLHLNVADTRGGAARAAYHLHQGLLTLGLRSSLLVDIRASQDPTVIRRNYALFGRRGAQLYAYLDKLPIFLLYGKRGMPWSINWMPRTTAAAVNRLEPDIVNLHWIGDGFVSLSELPRIRAPLVWTLHDMWAFTGGCHIDKGCGRYRQSCGNCPQLGSGRERDLSRWVWNRKAQNWRDTDITVAAPSRWMAEAARRSSLFRERRIEVIHNALDETVFKPAPKAQARQTLNLPPDSCIIAYGAVNALADPNKGFAYLQQALQRLASAGLASNVHVVIFGAAQPSVPPDLGFPATYLGVLHDDPALVLAYSAADVMVTPSMQEAFGKTALEALACGTPVVCFDTSGLKDVVEHRQCGYRARCFDVDDLAEGIAWVCRDADRRRQLAANARRRVEQHFTLVLQAQRYRALYEELLEARQRSSPP